MRCLKVGLRVGEIHDCFLVLSRDQCELHSLFRLQTHFVNEDERRVFTLTLDHWSGD